MYINGYRNYGYIDREKFVNLAVLIWTSFIKAFGVSLKLRALTFLLSFFGSEVGY